MPPVRSNWGPLQGAVAGLAAGLKLTLVPFVVAIGVMALALLGLRAAVVLGAAMGAGFILAMGPFAWQLWQTFGNPMFPHFNQIFRSPDWFAQHYADRRFLPRSALQAILYPFWWLKPTVGLVSELRMRDPRMAIAYIAWFGTLSIILIRQNTPSKRSILLLLGVVGLSYAAWAKLFGIYRYLVFLEALSVVVVMLMLVLLRPSRPWGPLAAFALIAGLAISFTIHPNWGHGPYGNRVLEADALPMEPGSLVVMVDSTPMSYLVTLTPADVRVLGLANNLIQPGEAHGLNRRIATAIAAHSGPIWSMSDPSTPDSVRDRVLAAYGLSSDGHCVVVHTSLAPGGHRFCPVHWLP